MRAPASSTLIPKRNPQSSLAFMSFSRDPDQRGPTMSLLFILTLQSRMTRSREWPFLLKVVLPCCPLLYSALQAHSSRSAMGMALTPDPAGKMEKKQKHRRANQSCDSGWCSTWTRGPVSDRRGRLKEQDAAEGTGWQSRFPVGLSGMKQGRTGFSRAQNSQGHCEKKLLSSKRSEVHALTTASPCFLVSLFLLGQNQLKDSLRGGSWGGGSRRSQHLAVWPTNGSVGTSMHQPKLHPLGTHCRVLRSHYLEP